MAAPEHYAFGPFRLDAAQHLLFRGNEVVELPPKAVEALLVLVRSAGRMVSREDLRAALWPDTWVTDNTLYQKIWLLRKALEIPGAPPLIDTHARLGYRFVGAVRRSSESPLAPGTAACWLTLGETARFALHEGENLLGRDADCDAALDLATISRHHARITVRDEEATLEDLGSKNGTFLNDQRVRTPEVLVPGDRVRLGEVPLVFRSAGRRDSTKTAG